MAESACKSFWNFGSEERADDRERSRKRFAAITARAKKLPDPPVEKVTPQEGAQGAVSGDQVAA